MAFDLPTQTGRDSDDSAVPKGRLVELGVVLDDTITGSIPLEKVSTSMTIEPLLLIGILVVGESLKAFPLGKYN